MNNRITVTLINGEKRKYDRNITLLTISRDVANLYTSTVVAAKVNNEVKDLQYSIDKDCLVDFLDLYTEAGAQVYRRSLTFVMIIAARELFPNCKVTVEHSLSKGLYCELYLGRETTEQDILALEKHMQKIIAEDRLIIRKSLPVAEAISLFEASGQIEKVELLQQLQRETVNIYYCGEAYDYFYSSMVPSTGYLKLFELYFYAPGFILRFPETAAPDRLPKFVEQPKLAQIFLEAERWGTILRCGYVATLNEHVRTGNIQDIIRVAEALHEKKVAQIADFVSDHRKEVRIILVAGPSSSGKTTFAQRLGIQLRVNGVRPMPISLDDYFVDRAHTPRDENGDYDFEDIEAIDLPLFNEHLIRLLEGEEVRIPYFNFLTGQREYNGHNIKLDKDQPLIIEGIHGLNERLTSAVSKEHKVKIYISALTQLSIDSHNRISTTDTRLIRRIVRDSKFRSHNALCTLQMWPSVRRGEERNIFPFQEEADIMFNSALIYELSVLKKYAEPLLQKVTNEYPQHSEAKRLLEFLAFFQSIEDNDIPFNSILREFIGNSCFSKE